MARVYNKIFDENEWKEVNRKNKLLIEDFLTELRQTRKKEGTVKQYKNDLRICMIYLKHKMNNKYILECTKKDIKKMSLWFSEELYLSNARTNRLMSVVRSLLDFAENDNENYEEYGNNVAKKVRGLPKEELREFNFLIGEQLIKLKDQLMEFKEHQKLMLLMMSYDSAKRRNKLIQINEHNLLDRNQTNIATRKIRKGFPLIYFSNTKGFMKLYLKQEGEDNIDSLWIIEEKRGL